MTVNSQDEVLSGLLKIYMRRDKTPRKPHCVSFDRLVEHLRNECIRLQAEHNVDLSFTETDLRRAIASFGPAAGTGRQPHVVIRTDSRKEFDAIRTDEQRRADKDEQDKYLGKYVAVSDNSLPSLTLSIDGVLTTV
jgi:hypothetical protein